MGGHDRDGLDDVCAGIARNERVVLDDGVIYHTYSAYSRGLDGLWGMYLWLDRAPRGRNEDRAETDPLNWLRRHDEYNGD